MSAELSVYVSRDSKGRGVGTLLYKVLEAALKKQGVTNAYACIAYPDGREDETLTMESVTSITRAGIAFAVILRTAA